MLPCRQDQDLGFIPFRIATFSRALMKIRMPMGQRGMVDFSAGDEVPAEGPSRSA